MKVYLLLLQYNVCVEPLRQMLLLSPSPLPWKHRSSELVPSKRESQVSSYKLRVFSFDRRTFLISSSERVIFPWETTDTDMWFSPKWYAIIGPPLNLRRKKLPRISLLWLTLSSERTFMRHMKRIVHFIHMNVPKNSVQREIYASFSSCKLILPSLLSSTCSNTRATWKRWNQLANRIVWNWVK